MLLWQAWRAYAHRAASYQSRAMLNAIYFLVFGPGATVARSLGARLLDLDPGPRDSYWIARQPTPPTLEGMERQF
ncbi:MAG: hypothetical protein M3069_05985 [Chloroflexota bacterium]|nr:hypothetical protein [Chloroflexota bacterium]